MQLLPVRQAVQQAARLCQTVQQKFISFSEKSGKEPVTIADYGSQALIGRALARHFPNDAVIAEESGQQFTELVSEEQQQQVIDLLAEIIESPVSRDNILRWLNQGQGKDRLRTWIIDPIDGTKGFLARRRYTIAVGLRHENIVTDSIMGCPGYGEKGLLLYTENNQVLGQPLYGNPADIQPHNLQVSPRTPDTRIFIAESVESAHADHDQLSLIYQTFQHESVRVDGQDKYAMIAAGDADLYIRLSPRKDYQHRIWDHAAGYALVKAAGGKVTDFEGRDLDFSQGQTLPHDGIIVSNGYIHNAALKALQKVLQS